jgi:hypothetical protein
MMLRIACRFLLLACDLFVVRYTYQFPNIYIIYIKKNTAMLCMGLKN